MATIRELVAITRTYSIVPFANPRSAQWRATELWVGEDRAQLCRDAPFDNFASMTPTAPEQLSEAIETLYRSESGRVLATLVRLLGDLDLAGLHHHPP